MQQLILTTVLLCLACGHVLFGQEVDDSLEHRLRKQLLTLSTKRAHTLQLDDTVHRFIEGFARRLESRDGSMFANKRGYFVASCRTGMPDTAFVIDIIPRLSRYDLDKEPVPKLYFYAEGRPVFLVSANPPWIYSQLFTGDGAEEFDLLMHMHTLPARKILTGGWEGYEISEKWLEAKAPSIGVRAEVVKLSDGGIYIYERLVEGQ